MKITARIAACILTAAMAAACTLTACAQETEAPESESVAAEQESARPEPVTFTDDLGNTVTVSDPRRVVACMGSFANAWELAGGTLVGASDDAYEFESFAIASQNVTRVGDFTSINLETVLALEPDFVIMTCGTGGRGSSSSQEDLKPALDAAGIPVAYFDVTDFAGYARMMEVFCTITCHEDLFAEHVTAKREAIDRIIAEAASQKMKPTALIMTTYSRGTRALSSASMAGGMLKELGAVNLADGNKDIMAEFSLESVVALDPDFIFVIPMGNDRDAAIANLERETKANPAWASLSAVQKGRYIILDPDLFLYKPNDRWDESYSTLFGHLYSAEAGK